MASGAMLPRHVQPVEWARHDAVWLAWPCAADLWGDALPAAQRQFVALCGAIDGERREILVPDADEESRARAALAAGAVAGAATAATASDGLAATASAGVRFHRIPFGDIWMRDIAPVFVHDQRGDLAAACFRFNGWGGKYVLPHDADVAARVAAAAGAARVPYDLVAEGGAVEVDGEGTLLTSRSCLLNANRNPGLGEEAVARALSEALGARRVLWVGEGLLEDHTDGHIDTIARFVAPGVVACMEPGGAGDPNAARLARIAEEVAAMTDAAGRRLRVVPVPSPGRVEDARGRLMPASYLNFYLANGSVAVPTYGAPRDEAAVHAVAALFPGRRATGVRAETILEGGGALHCVTQQQPAPRRALSERR
ncbi:MAG TPA: agmatine deiminase family protein [Myxococcota bacterium]|jgi:agmatine deiminase|nr:agmatine deiminase family protein [Myxococcota bacterium]